MIDSKQIIAYCKEQGWHCPVSYGKTNGKRCIYPSPWKMDNDKCLQSWWTIVIYRDEIDFLEMTKIMDKAFETIMARA